MDSYTMANGASMLKMVGAFTKTKELDTAILALGKRINVTAMVAKSLPLLFIKATFLETKRMALAY